MALSAILTQLQIDDERDRVTFDNLSALLGILSWTSSQHDLLCYDALLLTALTLCCLLHLVLITYYVFECHLVP